MKNKIIILLGVFCIACNTSYKTSVVNKDLYNVYKIDSINDYYLIYAKKKENLFKIVSEKDYTRNCDIIKKGQEYNFKLNSLTSQSPTINGIKTAPVTIVNVMCHEFKKDTRICTDRENGIYDLYFAENVKGLCLIE